MPENDPHRHHYVPQFYLRNFAVDFERNKITTVMKNGPFAIWAERSIKGLGFERDFYVHRRRGVPVSVESVISNQIESPLSKSDTWAKITGGDTASLDRSDKPILYALIRHLEARTPHYLNSQRELAAMAADPQSSMPFSDEERRFYAWLRANPEAVMADFNFMAATLEWTEATFAGAYMCICRSPIPLRSSSTPVHVVRAPAFERAYLPLPGMIPFQYILPLNRRTMAMLVLGDFDDAFTNIEISEEAARSFNRHYVGQFSHFAHIRHLITDRTELSTDMTWAPYDLVDEGEKKITYRRRPPVESLSDT